MTHSIESIPADVVWSGGALLPEREERSSLTMFLVARDIAPEDERATNVPAGPLKSRVKLRRAWNAFVVEHPALSGQCACGCGGPLPCANPNGRRRYLAGHHHMSTAVLRLRCRTAGIDLRKSVSA